MASLYKNIPETPGVYLMKGSKGRFLYIGKAANLRRRVSSYFAKANDARIEKLLSEVKKIDYKKTDSILEALILEAELIKKYQPRFNIKEKDDKSFLYIEITDEEFPRILLVRGKESVGKASYGPFVLASSVREALRILRKIFTWNSHPAKEVGKAKRPCFNFEVGLCPGTCVGAVSPRDYLKTIRNLKLFFKGKKKKLVVGLEREMKTASRNLEFEKAEKLRRQLFALKHIRDTALISDEKSQISNLKTQKLFRIEGYDISNISGTSAVGSMVVFSSGGASGGIGLEPNKSEYRKFKVRTVRRPDDVGMLREILRRRFKNDWPLPYLILIDGGKGQVNVVKDVLAEAGLKIPVVGIAKGPKRKKNEFIGKIPKWVDEKMLIRVRDEAHRFALSYHRKLRSDRMRG